MLDRLKKIALGFAFMAVAALSTGCGDSLTNTAQPMDSPTPRLGAFFSTSPAPGMTVMRRTEKLEKDMSVTAQFSYYETGWLSIEDAGIHIYIPEGAIMTKERTAITLTALAGDAVAFEFAPHGITFAKPLTVRVDADDTEAEYLKSQGRSSGVMNDVIGVYYEWNASGLAVPVEKFRVYWNEKTDGPGGDGSLEFYTNHFSGYAIAM